MRKLVQLKPTENIPIVIPIVIAIVLIACFVGLYTTLSQPASSPTLQSTASQLPPIAPPAFPPPTSKPLFELGQALFFDKELSGNRDIACATCHHPAHASGDAVELSIGTGGQGLGALRVRGTAIERAPRNSPALFNLGATEWHTLFWDGRVQQLPDGALVSVADDFLTNNALPTDLDGILAAQALFPVISRTEMRGEKGDVDVFGRKNELAEFEDHQYEAIWEAITQRLMAIEAYPPLFQSAFPGETDFNISHTANALSAYQTDAYRFADAPIDHFLAGDKTVFNDKQQQGADLFYGKAQCATCHSGTLFTDQKFYNLGVPHLGPGKVRDLDLGRYHADEAPNYFQFRTPSLRNVTLTAPYFHNGAYTTLEETILHHLNAEQMLRNFSPQHLPEDIAMTHRADAYSLNLIMYTLDPWAQSPPKLTVQEIDALVQFLATLTDPGTIDLNQLIPSAIPSGLPVDR